MKTQGAHRVRWGITPTIYLWGLMALLLALSLTGAIAWSVADDHARLDLDHKLDEDLQSIEATLQERNDDLVTLGRWLVRQENFNDAVRSRNSVALVELLTPLIESSFVDIFQVIDRNGEVVSRVTRSRSTTPSSEVSSDTTNVRTMVGRESLGLDADTLGQLLDRFSLPIYDDEHDLPIATLSLGFYLNSDSLRHMLARTKTDLAIVYKDRFAVNTLRDQQGNSWVGQLAPADALEAARENLPTKLLMVDNGQEPYLLKFKPLRVSASSTDSMLAVTAPLTSLETERWLLLREFGLGSLASALIVLSMGFFAARTFAHPLRQLTAATQTMIRGDLSTEIAIGRRNEVGELAQQLNLLRQHMRRTLQSETWEKQRYATIIQALTIPIVITDEKHLVSMVNPAAEAILKQSQINLTGRLWHSFFTLNDTDEAYVPPFWRSGVTGPDGAVGAVVRGRFPLHDQPQVVLDIISTPIQVDKGITGYVHTLKDATKLKEFDQVRDEFLLNVAHELETPLSSWRSSLDLLAEDYGSFSPRDLGAMLRIQRRVAIKFQGLVENLVDMGKLQTGQFRVRPVPTPIDRLVSDAQSQILSLLEMKGQALELRINCPSDCAVFADPARILQVIINLLKNASKYGPEGQPILLSICKREGFVMFEVTDHGPGISQEEQQNLFRRFYRTKRAQEEGTGLGLGLALSKGIVESHGGQIGVRSQIREGATFWFTLAEARLEQVDVT